MKTKRNRHITDVSIRELKVKFLLYHTRRSFLLFLNRFFYSIIIIVKESFEKLRKENKRYWKYIVSIDFEKDKQDRYWQVKFIFFVFIFDVQWYGKDNWNTNPLPPHINLHLWINSWKMVKIWGSCGSNMCTIFQWASTKRVHQTNLLKSMNPLRALKKVVILQRIEEMRDLYNSICDDPMNGCPEDFAEDGCRIENQLWGAYYAL